MSDRFLPRKTRQRPPWRHSSYCRAPQPSPRRRHLWGESRQRGHQRRFSLTGRPGCLRISGHKPIAAPCNHSRGSRVFVSRKPLGRSSGLAHRRAASHDQYDGSPELVDHPRPKSNRCDSRVRAKGEKRRASESLLSGRCDVDRYQWTQRDLSAPLFEIRCRTSIRACLKKHKR
jgi:hypothetical protein